MTEELTINVEITDCFEVKGTAGAARMIAFTGNSDCPNFKGEILPGGVDTQREIDGQLTLSARYMLKGVDRDGEPCSIFIENNGAGDISKGFTTPKIFTDSKALSYLENASLKGTIEPWEKGVIIHIFR